MDPKAYAYQQTGPTSDTMSNTQPSNASQSTGATTTESRSEAPGTAPPMYDGPDHLVDVAGMSADDQDVSAF
jgi:hypothetical protein